jgi:hypothetical protein
MRLDVRHVVQQRVEAGEVHGAGIDVHGPHLLCLCGREYRKDPGSGAEVECRVAWARQQRVGQDVLFFIELEDLGAVGQRLDLAQVVGDDQPAANRKQQVGCTIAAVRPRQQADVEHELRHALGKHFQDFALREDAW